MEAKTENPNKALPEKLRKHLVDAIIEYTTSNFIWVEQCEFIVLFNRIKAVFPDEALDTYFTPATQVSQPGGRLFNAFRYAHQILQKETGIAKRKRSKKEVVEARQEYESILTVDQSETLRKELIGRTEPWDAIKELWMKTFAYRRNEIEDESINRAEILQRWSKLKKKRGHELVSFNELVNKHFFIVCLFE